MVLIPAPVYSLVQAAWIPCVTTWRDHGRSIVARVSRARVGQRRWRQAGGSRHRSIEAAGDMNHNIKTWLLRIAEAVEQWPTSPRDDLGAPAAITTPAAVAVRMVIHRVPRPLRSGVARALPLLSTKDFAEGAHLIRTAAGLEPD